MELRAFVQTILLEEVRVMHRNGVRMHTLAAVAHGIEVCGALMDSKPFKAKGLGRTRFGLALSRLFPKEYLLADTKVDLYGQLRSHISHSMVPGQLVELSSGRPHLEFADGRLHLDLDAFIADYDRAILRLLDMVDGGKVNPKGGFDLTDNNR